MNTRRRRSPQPALRAPRPQASTTIDAPLNKRVDDPHYVLVLAPGQPAETVEAAQLEQATCAAILA
eukprot:827237-Pyramimonas_sp.AAC.1